jgi:uncharacterized alkaline shock family protein YloU
MTTEYHSSGKTTLMPEVLMTIARQAALEVDGVHSVSPVKAGLDGLLSRGLEGVRMQIEDGVVFLELFLVLDADVNIRETSRIIQMKVARTISEMAGLETHHVNIHIEDVFYKGEA